MRLKQAVHDAIEKFFLGMEGTFGYFRCPDCGSPNLLMIVKQQGVKSRKKYTDAYLFCNNCGYRVEDSISVQIKATKK